MRAIRDEHKAGGGDDVAARGHLRVTEGEILKNAPTWGGAPMIEGMVDAIELCLEDVPDLATILNVAAPVVGAIVPAPEPEGDRANEPGRHGLNPLLQMMNIRLVARRVLKGRSLDATEIDAIRQA